MSTYNADLSWEDNSNRAGQAAREIIAALTRAVNSYNEWQSFRGARTNAQIAADLTTPERTVTETEVADMDSCFAAGLTINSFANNGSEPYGDYFFSLRKFS